MPAELVKPFQEQGKRTKKATLLYAIGLTAAAKAASLLPILSNL